MGIKILSISLSILFVNILQAQDLAPIEITTEWRSRIEGMAPGSLKPPGAKMKQMLLFSLVTGYDHWVVPHTEAVVQILAEKSNEFEVSVSNNIKAFESDQIKKYDLIVLNNNCSERDRRNIFWDVLKLDSTMTADQKMKKAGRLEKNLLSFVRSGGGLVVLHGGITMQNSSVAFGKMVGGSFDYHPKQQNIRVIVADPGHPVVASFEQGGFDHVDEPYFFNRAYQDYNFHPLLYMEASQLEDLREEVTDNKRYIAWIKPYGKGRIFYASPSHNAQSFENRQFLQFLLNGMRYAAHELQCEDGPLLQP